MFRRHSCWSSVPLLKYTSLHAPRCVQFSVAFSTLSKGWQIGTIQGHGTDWMVQGKNPQEHDFRIGFCRILRGTSMILQTEFRLHVSGKDVGC